MRARTHTDIHIHLMYLMYLVPTYSHAGFGVPDQFRHPSDLVSVLAAPTPPYWVLPHTSSPRVETIPTTRQSVGFQMSKHYR